MFLYVPEKNKKKKNGMFICVQYLQLFQSSEKKNKKKK